MNLNDRQHSPDLGDTAAVVTSPPAPIAPDDAPARAPDAPPAKRGWLGGITRTVLVLGGVSLFTDMSSEMIMPLRLIFFVQVLSTPLALAGLIEGLAEGGTSLLRIVSGRVADFVADRRALVIAGYGVSNLSKPLLALVATWPVGLLLVLVDRTGKALRGSPRDAMIADAVAPEQRGKAFGFHRSADTLGAAVGPLLAIAVLAATAGNLRAVFGWTLAPGLLSLIVAVAFLRDPRRRQRQRAMADAQSPAAPFVVAPAAQPAPHTWQGLGARFWLFTVIATIFALGNSSDAFLFLRTEGLEASLIAVPLVYFAFNMIYTLLATPLGALSDRVGRLPMLAVGYGAFALVYLGWTQAKAPWHAWALFAVYGVYYAATDGVAKAFVTDLVPRARRGTAMGWFNGLTGVVALPANIVAAWLWAQFGPGATFALGAWLGAVSLGLLIAWWPWLRPNPIPWPEDPPHATTAERPTAPAAAK
jgi:MFS family permease